MLLSAAVSGAVEPGCPGSAAPDPAVIFCDDFEQGVLTGEAGPYLEGGQVFAPEPGMGLAGSQALVARWTQAGQVGAGGFLLPIGRVPEDGYRRSKIRPAEDLREIYWRFYHRTLAPWPMPNPAKLTRAWVFGSEDHWGQAAILHLWEGPAPLLDPVSGVLQVSGSDRMITTGYNDFEHFEWLGILRGRTPIYDADDAGRWFCIETRFRLNDPGAANGVAAYWIDGELQARRDDLDFVGTWDDYGINMVALENWVNEGAPAPAVRVMDNLVIPTARIGCDARPAARVIESASATALVAMAMVIGLAGAALAARLRRGHAGR